MGGVTLGAASQQRMQVVIVIFLGLFILLMVGAMFTGGPGTEVGWLGMTVTDLGSETAAEMGIPVTSGVRVEEAQGLAEKAGIRDGDVVHAINGNRTKDLVDFVHVTGETDITRGGVQIDIVRGGVVTPIVINPAGGVQGAQGAIAPGVVAPGILDRRWLGVDAESLTVGEARNFGAPAGSRGVLIEGVTPGGRGETAGLLPRDIIVSLNGRATATTATLWGQLASLRAMDRIEFGLYRGGRLTSVSLLPGLSTAAGGFGAGAGAGAGGGVLLTCPGCSTKVACTYDARNGLVSCPACGRRMVRVR